jgi:hypothetical protein
MSVHDSHRLNKTQSKYTAAFFSQAKLVDTNLVLRKAIQKLSPEVRNEVVLRCDELVQLQCSEENMDKAFTQLLQLIADAKPSDKKLFLHITCFQEGKKEKETIALGLRRYTIQFHTNVSLHAAEAHEVEYCINNIASLLPPFGGRLQVNQLKNSGCVFSISLPGK